MRICEIFASIQGESTYAGLPCVFVRLTGCNLRCAFCDTTYAYDEGDDMNVDSAVDAVGKFGINLVEITGGEPLLQSCVKELTSRLLDRGCKVLIETNGSVDIDAIDKRAVIIMDVKTPGSGMQDSVRTTNFALLKTTDELKFVLSGRTDYEWAVDFVKRYSLLDKCTILFSPVYGVLAPADLSRWLVADRLSVRLNLQLHKYIFDPHQRGV